MVLGWEEGKSASKGKLQCWKGDQQGQMKLSDTRKGPRSKELTEKGD